MAKGQSPALSPETAERYRQVVQMRAAGLTFDRIAQELGYASRSGAKEAYDAALNSWGREAVDNLRVLEGERVDELWRRTFARLLEADRNQAEVNEFLNIVMTAVRISKRRSELFGLDAPRQLEVSGLEGGAIRTDVGDLLITRLAELRDKQGPLAEELDKEPLIVEIPSETALEPSLDE
jgi:hypothetical protein